MDYSEFAFLADEVVPEVPSEDGEVDEVHPPQDVSRPSRTRVKSFYAAKEVDSVVMEAELFLRRDLFKFPAMSLFGSLGRRIEPTNLSKVA